MYFPLIVCIYKTADEVNAHAHNTDSVFTGENGCVVAGMAADAQPGRRDCSVCSGRSPSACSAAGAVEGCEAVPRLQIRPN